MVFLQMVHITRSAFLCGFLDIELGAFGSTVRLDDICWSVGFYLLAVLAN
jgi:hypothetical protein